MKQCAAGLCLEQHAEPATSVAMGPTLPSRGSVMAPQPWPQGGTLFITSKPSVAYKTVVVSGDPLRGSLAA